MRDPALYVMSCIHIVKETIAGMNAPITPEAEATARRVAGQAYCLLRKGFTPADMYALAYSEPPSPEPAALVIAAAMQALEHHAPFDPSVLEDPEWLRDFWATVQDHDALRYPESAELVHAAEA
jgi:hypothetical protein